MTGSKFCPICGAAARVRYCPYCSGSCMREGVRKLDTQNVERAALERARQARRAKLAAEYARTAELTGNYALEYGPVLPLRSAPASAPLVRHAGLLEVQASTRSRGADALAERLAALHLNAQQAAALLGMSRGSVNGYLDASRLPTEAVRALIERVFCIPAREWLVPARAPAEVE